MVYVPPMPDYSKLHDLVSHRIELEYDTGARMVGTLTACQPAAGKVQFAILANAELIDAQGRVYKRFDELTVCPNALVGVRLDEGPRGRDLK